jgi:hypothetical protein
LTFDEILDALYYKAEFDKIADFVAKYPEWQKTAVVAFRFRGNVIVYGKNRGSIDKKGKGWYTEHALKRTGVRQGRKRKACRLVGEPPLVYLRRQYVAKKALQDLAKAIENQEAVASVKVTITLKKPSKANERSKTQWKSKRMVKITLYEKTRHRGRYRLRRDKWNLP